MRGWEGYDVFTTLTLAEGEDDVYKQAVDALNTYFVPKRNRENDMYKLFPSVTSHKFYTAKKHGKELEHQYQRKNWPERIDDSKLDHFLDFINQRPTSLGKH